MEYNPDNELFLSFDRALKNTKPSRVKGYYICPSFGGCGTEFLKAAGRKQASCPFCGRVCDRVLTMSPVEAAMAEERWMEDGIWSALKADRLEKGA